MPNFYIARASGHAPPPSSEGVIQMCGTHSRTFTEQSQPHAATVAALPGRRTPTHAHIHASILKHKRICTQSRCYARRQRRPSNDPLHRVCVSVCVFLLFFRSSKECFRRWSRTTTTDGWRRRPAAAGMTNTARASATAAVIFALTRAAERQQRRSVSAAQRTRTRTDK